MESIKAIIGDYIFAFQMKNWIEKTRAIIKIIVEILIIAIVICSPFLVTRCHLTLEQDLSSRVDPTLSIDEKWHLVAKGRMHIECKDYTDEALRKAGFDPSTPQATQYAIEHGWCDFALTE